MTIDSNGNNITVGQALLATSGTGLAIGPVTSGLGITVYASSAGAPAVTFSGGGGSGATGYAKLDPSSGTVSGVYITNPGSGYTSPPTIVLGGVTETATAPLGLANTLGGLTKIGSGTLTLTGSSTYSGGTTVNSGTLQLIGPVAQGLGPIGASSPITVNSGATLLATGLDALYYKGSDYTSRTLTINEGGTLVAAQSDHLSLGYTLNVVGGTIASQGSAGYYGNFGNLVLQSFNSLNFTSAGDGTPSQLSAAVTSLITSGVVFNVTAGGGPVDLLVSGNLQNGANSQYVGGLTKTGNGVMVLAGSDTYTLGTAINAGTLNFGSLSPMGTGQVTFTGNSTLQAGISSATLANNIVLNPSVTGTFDTQTYSTTLSGIISGSGALTEIGNGALTLAGSGNYTGTTLVSGGSLVVANSAALSMSTFDTSGTGTLGFGTLTSATFGGLQGTAGTLTLNNAAASPTGVALTVGNNGGSSTYAGIVTGSGSLTKIGTGTLTLSGSNGYTGGTTISGGVLQFGPAAGTVPSSGTITIASGGVLVATGPTGYTTAANWLSSGRLSTASSGALALTANDSPTANYNLSGYSGLYLGSIGNNTCSGTLTAGSNGFFLGGGGGKLAVTSNLQGALLTTQGNVTISGTNNTLSGFTIQSGVLQLSGSTTVTGNVLENGPKANGTFLLISGGALNINAGVPGCLDADNGGVIDISGGSLNVLGSNHLTDNSIMIGVQNAASVGTMFIRGTASVTPPMPSPWASAARRRGMLVVADSAQVTTSTSVIIGGFYGLSNESGILTQTGGTITSTQPLYLGGYIGSSGTGSYNLDGGMVIAPFHHQGGRQRHVEPQRRHDPRQQRRQHLHAKSHRRQCLCRRRDLGHQRQQRHRGPEPAGHQRHRPGHAATGDRGTGSDQLCHRAGGHLQRQRRQRSHRLRQARSHQRNRQRRLYHLPGQRLHLAAHHPLERREHVRPPRRWALPTPSAG